MRGGEGEGVRKEEWGRTGPDSESRGRLVDVGEAEGREEATG